jgi:multiple sugar transport system permease protein
MRRRRISGRWRDWSVAYLFVAPAFVALLFLRVLPALQALRDSFYKPSMFNPDEVRFVGFDNYAFLFNEMPTFLQSMRVTVAFVAVTVAVQTAAALGLAVLFTQRGWGARVWRTVVFLPITIPFAVSAVVWGTALRSDGIVNGLLVQLGLPPQPFLSSPSQALWCIVVMASWIGVGYWMIFLIAGIRDVPEDVLEAASIDGAGPVRKFISITLPLLARPLAFVVVANTIANFLQFVPAAVLTQGGPQDSTRFIMYEIYSQAFVQGDTSLASAEIVLVLIVLLAIVTLQFRLLKARA